MSFKKKIFKFSISQKILAFIGYLYILFVCYTSKIQIINSKLPEKLWRENKPFILAFWHGQLMMIGYVWKSKAVLNMLASSHSDGRFGAYIAGHFNLKNVSIMSKNKSPSLRKVFKILKDRNYIGITPDGGLVFCDEGNENLPTIYNSLINETKKYKKWSVIIGPEGGFSEKERTTISSLSSCISVSLGKRILRSDTATTAAIFSIQSVIE